MIDSNKNFWKKKTFEIGFEATQKLFLEISKLPH